MGTVFIGGVELVDGPSPLKVTSRV